MKASTTFALILLFSLAVSVIVGVRLREYSVANANLIAAAAFVSLVAPLSIILWLRR